jgi:hypothetical protein
VIAGFFAAEREARPDQIVFGPCDRIVSASAWLEADLAEAGQAEADLEDEWDSADSNAYQDRVEAGLEPEAGL